MSVAGLFRSLTVLALSCRPCLHPARSNPPCPSPADIVGSCRHSLVLGNRLTSCLLFSNLQLLPMWQDAGSRGLLAVKTVCPSGSFCCGKPLRGSSGTLSPLGLASPCLFCTGPSGGCRLFCFPCPRPPWARLWALLQLSRTRSRLPGSPFLQGPRSLLEILLEPCHPLNLLRKPVGTCTRNVPSPSITLPFLGGWVEGRAVVSL